MNAHTSIILLAALYHESCRHAVQQGQTLAHAVGQPCSFTEFADLPPDAMRGRMLTAELLLRAHDFEPLPPMGDAVRDGPDVDDVARAIHRAERGAIRRGWTVVKLNPPRPWSPFDVLPEAAQNGRRHQARFFLARFSVRPKFVAAALQDFNRARASFIAGPAHDAARAWCLTRGGGSPELRWTGTPAEVEQHLAAVEEFLGIPVGLRTPQWTAELSAARVGAVRRATSPPTSPPSYRGMWNGVALYEDERGGGFAAEGIGGFTDPETGLWIETVTEGGGGETLVGTGRGHEMAPVSAARGSHEQKLLHRARRHMSVALGIMDEALTSVRRTLLADIGVTVDPPAPSNRVTALADSLEREATEVREYASGRDVVAAAWVLPLTTTALALASLLRRGAPDSATPDTIAPLKTPSEGAVMLPDPSGAPDDPAADVAAMHAIGAVAKAQDALVGAADAVQVVTDHGMLAMLQGVASKSIERLQKLAPSAGATFAGVALLDGAEEQVTRVAEPAAPPPSSAADAPF